jgi:hypothetical protein
VVTLRALREDLRSRSRLAGSLIDAIYEEYARFSPPIAAELRGNLAEQFLVLDHVVRPLFAWYTLAAALALTPPDACGDEEGQAAAFARLAEARPQEGAGPVRALLEGLRAGTLPATLPPQLVDLAPRIATDRFAAWAILDPLIRLWRGADRPFEPREEIADWLAAAPLDLLAAPCTRCGLAEELETIAGFLAFAPDRRATLAARLQTAWPDAAEVIGHSGLMRRRERLGH